MLTEFSPHYRRQGRAAVWISQGLLPVRWIKFDTFQVNKTTQSLFSEIFTVWGHNPKSLDIQIISKMWPISKDIHLPKWQSLDAKAKMTQILVALHKSFKSILHNHALWNKGRWWKDVPEEKEKTQSIKRKMLEMQNMFLKKVTLWAQFLDRDYRSKNQPFWN